MRLKSPNFKLPKPAPMDFAGAEAIAAEALAFLAEDPSRLTRFMTDTGLDPQTLASGLSERGVLAAALDHVTRDESLLLVLASALRRKPDEIMLAQGLLAGPAPQSSP